MFWYKLSFNFEHFQVNSISVENVGQIQRVYFNKKQFTLRLCIDSIRFCSVVSLLFGLYLDRSVNQSELV